MRRIVVRAGDHLIGLSHRHGLSADAVWNHAENRALREKRPNPAVLAPGDVIRIPEALPPGPSVSPNTTNRYKARRATVTMKLRLVTIDGPLAGEPFVVRGAGAPVEGQSDGDGWARFDLPSPTREAELHLPARDVVIPLVIGGLDPEDTESGARARLANLGFLGSAHPAHGNLEAAVRGLQAEKGLPVTGALDGATLAALVEEHGA